MRLDDSRKTKSQNSPHIKPKPLKITFVFASPFIKDKANPKAEIALSILDEFEGVRKVLQAENNKKDDK